MTSFKQSALKELTDQQVRFAPPTRRVEQLARAEQSAGGDCCRQTVSVPVCLLARDRLSAEHASEPADPRRRSDSRPAPHDRGDGRQGRSPGGSHRVQGAAAYRGKVPEPIVTLEEISKTAQRLDQNHSPLAQLWPGGSAHRFQRQASGRLPAIGGGSLFDDSSRPRGARQPLLADDARTNAKTSCGVPVVCRAFVAARSPRSAGASPAAWVARSRPSATRSRTTIASTRSRRCFPNLTGPLDAATKQTIYSSYRRGINVDTLAKRFQRTRTSMYRVINEVRAQRLLEQPLDYIPHPSFDDAAPGGRDPGPHARRRGLRGQAPRHARAQGRAAGVGLAATSTRC